jgi:hypothetical protein
MRDEYNKGGFQSEHQGKKNFCLLWSVLSEENSLLKCNI